MTDPKRLIIDSASDVERVLLRAGRLSVPIGAKDRAFVAALAALPSKGVVSGAFLGTGRGSAEGLATLRFVGGIVLAASAIAGVAGMARRQETLPSPTIATRNWALSTSATSAIAQPDGQPASSDDREPRRTDRPIPSPVPSARSTPAHGTTPVAAASSIEARAPKTAPSAQEKPPTLADEIAVLDDARHALSDGRPSNALSVLDSYAKRFPSGAMAPEAMLLRIEALVKSGDRSAALRLAETLRTDDPHSPYSERVRSLLNVENP
jgi:hypothetical protein